MRTQTVYGKVQRAALPALLMDWTADSGTLVHNLRFFHCSNDNKHVTAVMPMQHMLRRVPPPRAHYLCTKMVFMPSEVAMAHACCPPAPPKHASTCAAAS
jgi:hypothetical protein